LDEHFTQQIQDKVTERWNKLVDLCSEKPEK
jgi:hypothetical protein